MLFLRIPLLLSFVALVVSCRTVTLDMTDLDRPITLNATPFVGGQGRSGTSLGSFAAKNSYSHIVASFGGTTSSTTANIVEAPALAFESIGGYDDRAITGAQIKAKSQAANALFALADSVELGLSGEIMSYDLRKRTADSGSLTTRRHP